MAVDGQSEVAGNDENSLTGQATVDSDDVVAPADVAGFCGRGARWRVLVQRWLDRESLAALPSSVQRGVWPWRALCGRAWL